MPNKYLLIAKLMRLDSPTGYLLVFFPTAFGLLLAPDASNHLLLLPIFFIASILTRGAGCVINDIFDQKLDAKVNRTKDRPLASGKISNKEAIILLIILLLLSFSILLTLTITSIMLGFIAFFMMTLYPIMKRLTYFPQIFLGVTFNLGSLIAYASIKDAITYEAIIIYTACCFWTIGYDTIYAFSDIKDDKKVGIKSTAIFFEKKNYKMFLAICYFYFILLYFATNMMINNRLAIFGIGISSVLLAWQILTLNIKDSNNCLQRFKANNYVGFILFISMLLEYII